MPNLKEFISQLAEQWATIKAAPYPFAMAVATVVVVAFGAAWFIFNTTLSNKNAELSSMKGELELADRQIADYKQKLRGDSPDEAKAKIEALERRLIQLEPRHIAPQQRQTLVEMARTPDKTYRMVIEHESGCPDCPQYAAAFERALRDAGWNIGNGVVMGPAQRSATGIGLIVVDPQSPQAVLLQRAFRSARIDIEVMNAPAPPTPYTVGILITAKAPE